MSEPNALLAALPAAERDALRPRLEMIPLIAGHILYEEDDQVERVYFPYSGVVSLVTGVSPGRTVETGMIGREGLVGHQVALEQSFTLTRTVVQIDGEAACMSTNDLRVLLPASPRLALASQRYAHQFLLQVQQTAACNAAHQVRERLVRWLLLAHDRVGADTFPLTQEFLAGMLAVQRPSVSIAAGALQDAGLIRYARGRVTMVDRGGLEAVVCDCYALLRSREDETVL